MITVYAGAAFVILSLVDMVREPFELPNWSFKLIVVLLSIGLIIAVILSWIYDIHPEGGMVKTKPADKVKPEDIPKSSNSWKIASYISFVVIVALIVLNVIPRSEKKKVLANSIAVLLFDNDSPASENASYLNGYRTAIHNNLCQIKELRVLSLSSTEQYKNQAKTVPEIAKELGVGYLLTAHGLILKNRIRLTVQLIDANNNMVWSNPYERVIELVEDHIDLQSDISQLVAGKLQATITPEEKDLIEKIPTTNLTAYYFYQRGREEHWKYRIDPLDTMALYKARDLYNKALEYDLSFGQAYLGLARVYWELNLVEEYLTEQVMDSVLNLANLALSYDRYLAEAYMLRGNYFAVKGYKEQSLEEYNKAIDLNPNSWEVYEFKARLYQHDDLVETIKNLHKAISINQGRELPYLLHYLAGRYSFAGFFEIAREYLQERLRLDNDSAAFLALLGDVEFQSGNLEDHFKYLQKAYMLDSTNIDHLWAMSNYYMFVGQYEEMLMYINKWLDQLDIVLIPQYQYNGMHRVGIAYWKNNRFDEARHYFDLQIDYCNRSITMDNQYAQDFYAYYDRAGVHAFLEEREKAYEDLRRFNQRATNHSWMASLIKIDPLFDSIRDEPEFQQIVRDVEVKYEAEHERVRQWLEENDML